MYVKNTLTLSNVIAYTVYMGSNKREMYHSTVSEVETRDSGKGSNRLWNLEGRRGRGCNCGCVIVGIRFTLAHHSLRVVVPLISACSTCQREKV